MRVPLALSWPVLLLDLFVLLSVLSSADAKKHRARGGRRDRSVDLNSLDTNPLTNSVDFIWSSQTVATGDTAVLHCSFDAIFQQLRNGNVSAYSGGSRPSKRSAIYPSGATDPQSWPTKKRIDWVKENTITGEGLRLKVRRRARTTEKATLLATGKKVVIPDRRYRVYRPHNSALSVLIIRRAKKRDAGIFKCNLSGSSTRHKYLILNVTESKIEAVTSPAKMKARIGKDVTLWCNATGYPRPVVYWTREDSNRKLPDGSYQFWGNGLVVRRSTESDTGIYACYLDNFVQPVVSYKFTLIVEDRPWHLDGYKMRFDSSQWYPHTSEQPRPVLGKSYLLMCETRGSPKPLPRIKWFKDEKEIKNNRHYYIIEDRPEWRSSYTSSTLVIMKFMPRQAANYSCEAANVFRSKKRDFYIQDFDLTVQGEQGSSHNVISNMAGPDDTLGHVTEDDYTDPTEDIVPGLTGKASIKHVTSITEGSGTGILSDDEDYDDASGSGKGGEEDEEKKEEAGKGVEADD